MTRQHLWRISAGGNSAALVVLLLLLAVSPVLVENLSSPDWKQNGDTSFACDSTATSARPTRLVLIVIDGLRADSARDRRLMPTLVRLATQGGSGVAFVETLIPSTVAAIQALVAGLVVSPLSFFQDFSARQSRNGGVFAGVVACGGETFVAGPQLWVDLYGQWITASEVVEGIGERDEEILQAGLAALEARRYSLVVFHFSRSDDAAHRYGAGTPEYTEAARWCDDALAQVLKRIESHTAVLVTSDHGVISRGGHAGPEPAARITPVATFGPNVPQGDIGAIRQRDIPLLLFPPLGLIVSPHPLPTAVAKRPPLFGPFVLLAVIGVSCCVRFWSAVAHGASGRHESTALNAVLWIVLLLALLGWRMTATGLVVAALAAVALWRQAGKLSTLVAALLLGLVCGVVRLTDGFLTSQREVLSALPEENIFVWWALISILLVLLIVLAVVLWHRPLVKASPATPVIYLFRFLCMASAFILGGSPLLTLVIAAIGLGVCLGRIMFATGTRALWAGVLVAVTPIVLARLSGETVSLSTIDVSVAFAVAEGPLGLEGAIVVVLVRLALLILGMILGLAPALRAQSPVVTGCFSIGVAALMGGQALPTAGLLALYGTDPMLGSLALGATLRIFSELLLSFLGSALALTVSAPIVKERNTISTTSSCGPRRMRGLKRATKHRASAHGVT